MSRVWRNSEGRELLDCDGSLWQVLHNDGLPDNVLRSLGYELVDASEVPPKNKWERMFAGIYDKAMAEKKSATQVGSPSGGTPVAKEVPLPMHGLAWFCPECDVRLVPDGRYYLSLPPKSGYRCPQCGKTWVLGDPEPPKGESEEFEVVCHGSIGGYKDEEDCGVPVMKQTLGVVHHPRLIPGKTYVVRLKGEK